MKRLLASALSVLMCQLFFPAQAPAQDFLPEIQQEETKTDTNTEEKDRALFPFEKPVWSFNDQTCHTYMIAVESGLTEKADHYLKATWAYMAGLNRRQYIYNPINAPVERPLVELVKLMCHSGKVQNTTIPDLIKVHSQYLAPEIGKPDDTNKATGKLAMDRQVLDFENVTCLPLVTAMIDGKPSADFIRQQDILWSYYAGELAVDPIDITAARKQGNDKLKELCINGGDPDTRLIGLMRKNHEEIRAILKVKKDKAE